ncbi:Hypothetical protein CINCED_3A019906 [Cinara cedri]|uniref:Uncharacterized protein n=1 Tax=Cinara cedri TaxID=506608 RepID=A0A5E4NJI9_9HEMI|nr:Hypothetical protein CINCED_3A019906 [Cinara cedri]
MTTSQSAIRLGIKRRCQKNAEAGVLVKLTDGHHTLLNQFILDCFYSKKTENFCRIPVNAKKIYVTFANIQRSNNVEECVVDPPIPDDSCVTIHLYDDNGRVVGKRYLDHCKSFEVLQFSFSLPKSATVVFVKFGKNLRNRSDAHFPDTSEFN